MLLVVTFARRLQYLVHFVHELATVLDLLQGLNAVSINLKITINECE